MLNLFDYQQAAVNDVDGLYEAGYRAPLLVLPTGAGKTVCFTHVADRKQKQGGRVLLMAHRRELVGQISKALRAWGVSHGVISSDAKPTNHTVQVGMVQTLANRIKLDKKGRFKFDWVIIDEGHHAIEDSGFGAVIAHNSGARLLAVSATPCRLDGKGLGIHAQGFFDSMVVGPSVSELIARGRLVQPVIYSPQQHLDLSVGKSRKGDFVNSQLAAAVDRSEITGDAVAHYRRYCDGQSAIAFTVTTDHAWHVVEQFKAAGYQAAVLTGKTPDKERTRMIRDLGNGGLQVLASCNVVSEGTDIPAVSAAILLRPSLSYSLVMQQIGRALRVAPGKDKAIILDHADNVRRHGLPTDEVEWSLDGMRKGKASVKFCYSCHAVMGSADRVCAACGHVISASASQAVERAGRDEVAIRQGELVEMTPEMMEQVRQRKRSELINAQTKADLIQLGESRNYKNPEYWAGKILEERRQYRMGSRV
jgi:DNA repair protein RadD